MKPLTIIYWIRAVLGFIIGFMCAAYVYLTVTGELTSIYTLLTGVSFALLFYIATYYMIKLRFMDKVEKASKLITHGIGIYFFSWLITWTLLVTLFTPTVLVTIDTDAGLGETGFEISVYASGGALVYERNVTAGSYRITLLSPGDYAFDLKNVTSLPAGYTIENQSQNIVVDWLQSRDVVFSVFNATPTP